MRLSGVAINSSVGKEDRSAAPTVEVLRLTRPPGNGARVRHYWAFVDSLGRAWDLAACTLAAFFFQRGNKWRRLTYSKRHSQETPLALCTQPMARSQRNLAIKNKGMSW